MRKSATFNCFVIITSLKFIQTSDLFEGQASEELADVEGGGFGGSGVSAGVRQLYDLSGGDGRSQTEALEQLRRGTAAGRGPRRDADVGRVLLLRLVTHCRRQDRHTRDHSIHTGDFMKRDFYFDTDALESQNKSPDCKQENVSADGNN